MAPPSAVTRKSGTFRRFENRTVLVNGGAGGMGRAAAIRFAAEGGKVGIIDIQDEAGRDTEKQIREAGGTALFVKADATKAAEVHSALTLVNAAFGPVKCAVQPCWDDHCEPVS